ncbi:MAG: transposase [Anaerolineae bacterium]|nr:transposase [Anaerolineae bacterium]
MMPLPGYSPDLNPIEGLWKWMREEVTQHIATPQCVTCSMPAKPSLIAVIRTLSP